MTWLDPLRAVLEDAPAPVTIFVRDDDAGWDDARLFALLDLFEQHDAPIDLAVIPTALHPGLAAELLRRRDATGGRIGLHQHGFSHTNHQRHGRRCEFGSERSFTAQRADLSEGRRILRDAFGEQLDSIFTPPWNRCTEATPALLAELGFTALSRDRGAKPAQHALQEIAVDLDWSKHWREGGAPALAAAFAHTLRERAADSQPLGLMLHHAVMHQDELCLLKEVLHALSAHPQVRWRSMRDLLRPTKNTQQNTACTSSA
jgi:predicted deacetylase